jgi:hypothetical protein
VRRVENDRRAARRIACRVENDRRSFVFLGSVRVALRVAPRVALRVETDRRSFVFLGSARVASRVACCGQFLKLPTTLGSRK